MSCLCAVQFPWRNPLASLLLNSGLKVPNYSSIRRTYFPNVQGHCRALCWLTESSLPKLRHFCSLFDDELQTESARAEPQCFLLKSLLALSQFLCVCVCVCVTVNSDNCNSLGHVYESYAPQQCQIKLEFMGFISARTLLSPWDFIVPSSTFVLLSLSHVNTGARGSKVTRSAPSPSTRASHRPVTQPCGALPSGPPPSLPPAAVPTAGQEL